MTYDPETATGLPARPADADPKYIQFPYEVDVETRGPRIYWGTGSPEGVVTGIVGDAFIRQDGGAGTTWYLKETGSGNTGWAGV